MATITIVAGKTHYVKLVYKDGGGNIIDITDATAKLMVRKSMYTAALLDVNAIIVGAAGEMTFLIEPATTVNLLDNKCSDTFICGAELTLASGSKIPFLEGSDFIIKQAVVR